MNITHTKTPTCFGAQVPSSGSYYNKSVRANIQTYVKLMTMNTTQIGIFIYVLYILHHEVYLLENIDSVYY